MRVTRLLAAVFVLAPALASAQLPCSSDAQSAADAIYRRVLERPAGSEANALADRLSSGQTSVREAIREVAKSAEHRQRFLQRGGPNGRLEAVTHLYHHLLARDPDPEGLNSHARALAGGANVDEVIDTFINSAEYQQKWGSDAVPGASTRYCRGASESARNDDNNANRGRMRFRNMDRNGNGAIEFEEWNGNRRAFENLDRNNDGVLSGAEVEPGARGRGANDEGAVERFDDLDLDRNGRIERREWRDTANAFNWLDRNNDNVLSRAELEGGNSDQADSAVTFDTLDVNNDGTLRPNEWRWARRIFNQYDSDGDGLLTRREFNAGGGAPR